MPTVRRLKTRPQFLEVAAARRKWVAPGLILQAKRRVPPQASAIGACPDSASGNAPCAPDADDIVRIGFTVSRKVGNAVQRNRARRRLRAVAEEVLPMAGKAGFDYVLIGRAATLQRGFQDLRDDLRNALSGVAAGIARDKRKSRAPRKSDSARGIPAGEKAQGR